MKFCKNKKRYYVRGNGGDSNIFPYFSFYSLYNLIFKNTQTLCKYILLNDNSKIFFLIFFILFVFFDESEAEKNVWIQPKVMSDIMKDHSKIQQQQQDYKKPSQQHHLRIKLTDEFSSINYLRKFNFYGTSLASYKLRPLNDIKQDLNKLVHKKTFFVTAEIPIHILFPLPTEQGPQELNPFGITIALTKPVVDIAVEEVYRRGLVSLNSLNIHFEDSKLSDAHGPNVAINQLVDNRLDCIIGNFLLIILNIF